MKEHGGAGEEQGQRRTGLCWGRLLERPLFSWCRFFFFELDLFRIQSMNQGMMEESFCPAAAETDSVSCLRELDLLLQD